MHLLHGKSAVNAMPIVASGNMVCLQDHESGRQLFKVEASSGGGTWYRVLLHDYCECPAFFQQLCKGQGVCVRAPLMVVACLLCILSEAGSTRASDRYETKEHLCRCPPDTAGGCRSHLSPHACSLLRACHALLSSPSTYILGYGMAGVRFVSLVSRARACSASIKWRRRSEPRQGLATCKASPPRSWHLN